MSNWIYTLLFVFSVFAAACSQVLLKKAANESTGGFKSDYLNIKVILAYLIFVGTTLLTMYCYKGVPLSMGALIESTSYIFVFIFGAIFFDERIAAKKVIFLCGIVVGIVIYGVG